MRHLLKLPKQNLVNLMLSALDEMQVYNGRSKTECIATALGATEDRLPVLAEDRRIV